MVSADALARRRCVRAQLSEERAFNCAGIRAGVKELGLHVPTEHAGEICNTCVKHIVSKI